VRTSEVDGCGGRWRRRFGARGLDYDGVGCGRRSQRAGLWPPRLGHDRGPRSRADKRKSPAEPKRLRRGKVYASDGGGTAAAGTSGWLGQLAAGPRTGHMTCRRPDDPGTRGQRSYSARRPLNVVDGKHQWNAFSFSRQRADRRAPVIAPREPRRCARTRR